MGAKEKGAWVESLIQRRPPNVAVAALANKMARSIYAHFYWSGQLKFEVFMLHISREHPGNIFW
jgi:hypothetical protein